MYGAEITVAGFRALGQAAHLSNLRTLGVEVPKDAHTVIRNSPCFNEELKRELLDR